MGVKGKTKSYTPVADMTERWVNEQSKFTKSINLLIYIAISEYGYTDLNKLDEEEFIKAYRNAANVILGKKEQFSKSQNDIVVQAENNQLVAQSSGDICAEPNVSSTVDVFANAMTNEAVSYNKNTDLGSYSDFL